MRKLIMIIAALMLLAMPASAGYLEAADRAENAEAAAELREYVYDSGAAQDVRAEIRRIYLYNYMLNLKKQEWDYAQQVRTGVLELSGEYPDLEDNTKHIYEAYNMSARLQAEIAKNEAYLEKITDAGSVTKKADELMEKLSPEKEKPTPAKKKHAERQTGNESRIWRYIADIAAIVAIIGLIALIWLCMERIDSSKMSQRKRDCLRMIHDGRYIILATALICAVVFGVVSAVYIKPSNERTTVSVRSTDSESSAKNKTANSESSADTERESTGEYLTTVEALDKHVFAEIESGIDAMENVWKYEIASAYGDILNDCVAKDMDSLIKAYETRAETARAEADRKRAAASRNFESALDGSDERYAERMNRYIDLSIEAGNLTFEAEYCDNIIALMTNEYVVTTPEAEEKVKADIEAIYDRIDEIINPKAEAEPEPEPEPETETESKPEPPLYELYIVLGLIVGGIFSAALILIIGRIKLARRMRDQKMVTDNSEHGEMMDDTNFRG
ncbi:MAG: hypothetical protein J1F63_03220 [Oscillospiraceae bacterium]|nr:hypothetical protein [Oscillospiraceae bacterium]